MIEIIKAIKSTLQAADILNYVSDSAILIEADDAYLPIHNAYPMITIKDGDVERERAWTGQSSGFLVKEEVRIYLWQIMKADDTSIISTGSTKGLLVMQSDVDSILHANTLSLSSVLDVYCANESETEIVEFEELHVLRKTLNYTYLTMEVK